AFGARNLGLRGTELDERVRRALEVVGLDDHIDDNPYDLGYSKRKLLATASILAMRTPAVVLDEPTTGQDAPGVARVQLIVRDLGGLDRSPQGRPIAGAAHYGWRLNQTPPGPS